MIPDPRTREEWLTVPDVAAAVGVTPATVYSWIRRHNLTGAKVGRVTYYRLVDVARCEKARRDTPQFGSRNVPRFSPENRA